MRVSVKLARVTGAVRCKYSMFKCANYGTITLGELLADTLANVERAIRGRRRKKAVLKKRKAKR